MKTAFRHLNKVYDSLQRLNSASSGQAEYNYANSYADNVTNETATLNGAQNTLTRDFDSYNRLVSLTVNGNTVHYGYNSQGRLAAISNDLFKTEYHYSPDGYDAGYSITASAGLNLTRNIERDTYRRQLVTAITSSVNGTPLGSLNYDYDLLGRVTARNNDTFDYNHRSEVIATEIQPAHSSRYDFDYIGNNRWTALNSTTNYYTANQLNQYTNILHATAPSCEPQYDLDGNLTSDGTYNYTYDAENRLIAAYSGNTLVISNAYDHGSRRVLKVTPTATHTYLYNGWNLVEETITTSSSTTTNHYIWGKDLSGTLQGAGGVGGLLAVIQRRYGSPSRPFFPLYDNNGNVLSYIDESGNAVAHRKYDAFGNTIAAWNYGRGF